jgi:putative RNA 2'-phosphotransferase
MGIAVDPRIARLVTTDDTRRSKLLSYVLRHRPEDAGVTLDPQGWVEVEALLRGLNARGTVLTRTDLDRIVAADSKRRYAYSDDGARIRASQGHSVDVDLGYEPAEPPPLLYHGTAEKNLASILATGLDRRERHHVHLSAAVATARQVGGRHGRPVVLHVDAARMHADGFAFFVTANGVWLVERVPPEYLAVPPGPVRSALRSRR